MHQNPSLQNYFKIIKDIVIVSILNDKMTLVVSIVAVIFNFGSAFLVVKTSEYTSFIQQSYNNDNFNKTLKNFLYLGLVTALFKFIAPIIFTFNLQNIQRNRFVFYIKEILDMNYIDFHKKTPGELQYSIWLKAYSAPMCCKLLVIEFSSIIGTILFSGLKIYQNVNLKSTLSFLVVPVFYFFSIFFYVKNKIKFHYELLKNQENTANKLTDKLLNYEAIKTFNLEKDQSNDLYNILGAQAKSSIKMGKYESLSKFILSFILNMPFVFILIMNMSYRNELGLFLQMIILYNNMASELKRIGNEIDTLIEYLNQINFTSAVRNENVCCCKESCKCSLKKSLKVIEDFKESIELKDFSIFYKEKIILKNINLKINKNEKVAVIGKNGAGKSTFIKSLLQFTETKGKMLIDGVDVKSLQKKALFDMISYVPQEDFTSDDTIIQNILLGFNSSTTPKFKKKYKDLDLGDIGLLKNYNCSKSKYLKLLIKKIAVSFGLHETFVNLPNGYETKVGPRGNKLSGGQRQKLSLMRACLKNAPIFIFDEATASMDKEYEKSLINSIFKNLNEKTILMIVHGKEYLKEFDKIIFLNEKGLEVAGSYEKCLLNNKFKNFIE